MIGWIHNSDLQSYKDLLEQEKQSPVILDEKDDKSLVQMTANAIQTWMQAGMFFEFA